MRSTHQKGFTIVEVVLFLAISGIFLLVAFAGIRGRTSNVQFTDSIRSLQSFFVTEQNKLLNGVNISVTSPCSSVDVGKSRDCVLMGRVMSFGTDSTDQTYIKSESLYGARPSSLDVASLSDLVLIDDAEPTPDAQLSEYNISWGTVFVEDTSVELDVPGEKIDKIGWVRSPGSAKIYPVAFVFGSDITSGAVTNNFNSLNPVIRLDDGVNVRLCFASVDGRLASITFGDGTGNSSINTVFDDMDCL